MSESIWVSYFDIIYIKTENNQNFDLNKNDEKDVSFRTLSVHDCCGL